MILLLIHISSVKSLCLTISDEWGADLNYIIIIITDTNFFAVSLTLYVKNSGFKVIGSEGYDDGGVADLSLLIDLEDSVQRRKRGENEYFTALKADLLPRATRGPMAKMTRREQKVSLAQLLFSEDDDSDDKGPSEVYVEPHGGDDEDGEDMEDAMTLKHRRDRLAQARAALRLSLLLREPACACLSLSELCKRKLTMSGKKGAEEALR